MSSPWDWGILLLVCLLPFSIITHLTRSNDFDPDLNVCVLQHDEVFSTTMHLPSSTTTTTHLPSSTTLLTSSTSSTSSLSDEHGASSSSSTEISSAMKRRLARQFSRLIKPDSKQPLAVVYIVSFDDDIQDLTPLSQNLAAHIKQNSDLIVHVVYLISSHLPTPLMEQILAQFLNCEPESLGSYTSAHSSTSHCSVIVRNYLAKGISGLLALLDAIDLALALRPDVPLLVHVSHDHQVGVQPAEYRKMLQQLLTSGANIAAPAGLLDYTTPERRRFNGAPVYVETNSSLAQPELLQSLTSTDVHRYFSVGSVTGSPRAFAHVGLPWFVLRRQFCRWMQHSDLARNLLFLFAHTLNPRISYIPTLLMESHWNITVPGQTQNPSNSFTIHFDDVSNNLTALAFVPLLDSSDYQKKFLFGKWQSEEESERLDFQINHFD